MTLLQRVLAVVVALLTPLASQDVGGPQCRDCQNRGQIDCRQHGKDVLALERGVLFCSVAADCKTCAGALGIDCRICSNPQVEKELEERRKLAAEWLQQRRREVDQVCKSEGILHLKTAHLDLAFSVKPLTVGRDKLDTHRLMHLYGQRIEELHAKFKEVFGVTDKDLAARLQILMFKDAVDHRTMAPRVTGGGGGSSASQKLMGTHSVLSMWHDTRGMPGDEGLWRSVVHNVTHLLLSNMRPEQWLGNRKYGWIDEGVAHWFEDLLTGKCTNFCYEEVALQIGAGFKGGRWRVPVRKMLDGGKVKPFAEIAQLNTDQLDFEAHALVFAYIDFLMQKHGGKQMAELVRAAKKGLAARDALQQVYGLNPLTFEPQFQEWVKATYPTEDR